ncbi:MAG: hypothetical protein KY475_01955 [Planctomycetes bacterium]|nr:hypothetical protein [Planctomycetota bacterium]
MKLSDREVLIEDDGAAFDPLEIRESSGAGLFFLQLFREKYESLLTCSYQRIDGRNALSLLFSRPLRERQVRHVCQITLASLEAFDPVKAVFLADRVEIPRNCPMVYFHVSSCAFSLSSLVMFVDALVRRIPEESQLTLSFGHNDLLLYAARTFVAAGRWQGRVFLQD